MNLSHLRNKLVEKTLTPAEKKKREEVAKAIERENPGMPMGMKMAIATKTAKRVAEEEKLDEQNLKKMSTEKLQAHWNKHKDEERPSPVFAAQLKRVGQELARRKAIQNKPVNEQIKTTHDPREYDYEGDMAKSQLRTIIANAQTVHDMLEDNTNIAEWVQSKITLSADYMATVRDYMQSNKEE